MRIALVLALALALALPGCSILPPDPGPKDVSGPTRGYDPTASFLKVKIRDESSGNTTLVDFDRRDWAVSEIAKRIDERNVTYLAVHGHAREILGEVLVQDVRLPSDLAQLSYQNMHATAEQRAFYEAAYDALLRRVADASAAPSPTLSFPTL